MPIDRAEFERGEESSDVQEQVQDFLYENDEQAFTVPDIASEIGNPELPSEVGEDAEELTEYQLDLVAVKAVLINLHHRGAINSRYVETDRGTCVYYKGLSEDEQPGE